MTNNSQFKPFSIRKEESIGKIKKETNYKLLSPVRYDIEAVKSKLESGLYQSQGTNTVYGIHSKVAKIVLSKDIEKLHNTDDDIGVNIGKERSVWLQAFTDKNHPIEKMIPNAFDRIVYNAVSTLYEQHNPYMSYAQIYRKIHSLKTNHPVSESNIKELKEILHKLNSIKLTADFTEQYESYNLSIDKNYIQVGNIPLLDFYTTKAKVNGKETEGIMLRETPILYFNASVVKQISEYQDEERNLIQIGLQSTNQNRIIIDYLLERINDMKQAKKNKKATSNKILISSIIDEVNTYRKDDKISPKVYRNICNSVYSILNSFVYEDRISSYVKLDKSNKKAVKRVTKVQINL